MNFKSFEYQYSDSLSNVLKKGVRSENRTGIDTLAVQHQYFYIANVARQFPILRGKKVFPKMALKELVWMMMGRTDIQWLHDHKVTYWDEWQDENGTIGRSYGYQYRNFNGVDQLKELVKGMLYNPTSRRHIINLWNASDLDKMTLPPCMYDYHFSCVPADRVFNKKNAYYVDLHVRARSNDSFLGVPYDFMFAGWFVMLICTYLNKKSTEHTYLPHDIHYTADDYHMYVNHIKQAKEYIGNVKENRDNVVKLNQSLAYIDTDVVLEDFVEIPNSVDDIDSFIACIEKNISTKNIQVMNGYQPASGFEYGTITAPIAV